MTCRCEHPPASLGSVSVPLLSGDSGIAQTIHAIRRQVDIGVKSADVNRYAIDAIRQSHAAPYDQVSQAYAIWAAVADPHEFTYVADPVGPEGAKETIRPASAILAMRGGDCDDLNGVLIPSLMGTIGLKTRLVTVATDPEEPETFTHVYAEVEAPAGSGAWYAVDAARPDAEFGLAPEHVFRREVWSLADESHGASLFGVRHSLAGYVALKGPKMYGPRRRLDGLRTMGDAASDINAIGASTADIILAAQAAPQNIYGVVNTGGGVPNAMVSPYAGYPTATTGYVQTPFGVMQTGSALLLGVGALIGLVALMSAFKR